MLDARNIFRKVSRAVYDFSPEQQKNIAAIVWLYRGQAGALPEAGRKLSRAGHRARAKRRSEPLAAFEEALGKLVDLIEPFAKTKRETDPLAEPWDELTGAQATLTADIEAFGKEAAAQANGWAKARARQCRAERGAARRCTRWRIAAAT